VLASLESAVKVLSEFNLTYLQRPERTEPGGLGAHPRKINFPGFLGVSMGNPTKSGTWGTEESGASDIADMQLPIPIMVWAPNR
jgi:hypothetical protein